MTENNNQILECFDITGKAEKIRKYGDPKRNLLITICVVILSAFLLFLLFGNKKHVGGRTSDYAVFYPRSTVFYSDVQLNSSIINKLNQTTLVNVHTTPDMMKSLGLVGNMPPRTRKYLSVMMGNSFSYGEWTLKPGEKHRYLFVSNILNEMNSDKVFKKLLANGEKLSVKVYKGYRITFVKDGAAYTVHRNKLFVSDSYYSMAFIVSNFFVNHNKSVFDNDRFINVVKLLNNDRIASIYFKNTPESFKNIGSMINSDMDFSKLATAFNDTAGAFVYNNNSLNLDLYTTYSSLKIKSFIIFDKLKNLFSKSSSILSECNIPDTTATYVSVKGIKKFINLYMMMYHISGSSEYNQLKGFFNQLTRLDFEKDILNEFNRDVLILNIKTAPNTYEPLVVIPATEKTDFIHSRLLSAIKKNNLGAGVYQLKYRNVPFENLKSSKVPISLDYARFSNGYYVLGQKKPFLAFIDANYSNVLKSNDKVLDSNYSLLKFYVNPKNASLESLNVFSFNRVNLVPFLKHSKGINVDMSMDTNVFKTSVSVDY